LSVSTPPATSNGSYSYLQFFPYNNGYNFPNGYAQNFIQSGTFDPNTNRLSFWVKSTNNVVRRSDGGTILEFGTYIRAHNNTDVTYQGQHYYHQMDPDLYAGQWTLFTINEKPQHQRGVAATPGVYREWYYRTTGAPVHYFDGLTRFYFNGLYQPSWVGSYSFKDFQFSTVSGEPDALVASVAASYTGTGYELTWEGPAGTAQNFDIAYST